MVRLLLGVLFLSTAALVPAHVRASALGDAWFREVVGTWKVDAPKGGAEIAIWERQLRKDRPSQSAFTVYHGIARTLDGACAYSFEGERNGIAGHYPRDQNTKDVHLRAYFGVPITRGKWITQFTDPNDPKPVWNRRDPSVGTAQVEWAKRIDVRRRACLDRIDSFFVYPQSENGPWVVETEYNLHNTDGRSGQRIEKTAASPGMLRLIRTYSNQNARSASGRAKQPSSRDLAVIMNPSATTGAAPSINSQCNQKRMSAGYRLARATGYAKLEVRAVDEKTVAVTQHLPRVSMKGRPATEVAYYPKQSGVDWDALSLIGHIGGQPNPVCQSTQALDAFLQLQADEPAAAAPEDVEVLDTYDGLYMVDRHGVGRVVISKRFSGENYIERVFGSSGGTMPGDKTHNVNQKPASGTMMVLPTIKNVVTGEVKTAGGVMAPDIIRIAKDQIASDLLQADAYLGTITPRQDNLCVAWRRDISLKTCEQRAADAQRTKKVFFLKDKALAIKTFKIMSPDPDTWTPSLETDDCSTGPFCGPNGSKLLRAIYIGDDESVRRLEAGLIPNSTKVLKDYFKLYGEDNARITVLHRLINEYMYDYQNRAKACFEPGAKEMVFERTTNKLVYENGFGMEMFSFGGDELYGRYEINKEFVEICQKVCDVREAAVVASVIGAIFEGPDFSRQVGKMLQFARNTDCKSADVKQFERNFIEIYKTSQPYSFEGYAEYELSWY